MSGASVLIVEDDPALLRGLKDNFEAQDYCVRIARDGREGLCAALAHPPDLLVLDIMLPKMNGYEICRALRSKQMDLPIIMLTAKGQEEDIIRGLELGADDYVTKPFSIRELLARAKAFLRRRQAVTSTALQFGECRLDLTAHKLFRNGHEVVLTTKEFRLLEFFASRPGRALTRDQILDAVWGNDSDIGERTVDVHIRRLRQAIALPEAADPIRTVRSAGYALEPPGPRG